MKSSYLPILIVLALLLSSASGNPRGKQHKRTATKEPEQTQQRQQEPTVPLRVFQATQSALSQALRTIQTQEEAAAKHDRPHKDDWDKAAVIADYLLFLVGCLYTYFAWGQWGEIGKQALIANKSLIEARKAAEAAGRAATATEDSNKQARQAMETELRAYLSIVRIILITPTFDDPAHQPRPGVLDDVVQVIVKNSGKTPAYNTTAAANTFTVPARNTLPDDFAYADLPSSVPDFLTAAVTVTAESEISFGCPSVPSPERLRSVRSGENWLYIYGHIDYVDVFKKPHRTPFCWLYVQGRTRTEYTLTTYKDHNTPD